MQSLKLETDAMSSKRQAATWSNGRPPKAKRAAHEVARKLREESGQAIVVTAMVVPIMVGCIAMCVDMGVLFHEKRNLQIAADAAAIAGAVDYLYNGSAQSAQKAAGVASSVNGFEDQSGGVTVTTSVPPVDGPNAGVNGYVETIVSKPIPTVFMRVLGFSDVVVKARGVAGTPAYGTACIWALSQTGTGLDLQGKYDIEAPDCGIYVNSTSSDAVSVTGAAGTVNALFLDAVGNTAPKHQTNPTAVTPNSAARSNPWGNLTGPTPSNGECTTTDSLTTTISATITGPGTGYAVCYTKAVTLNGATLGPGTYVFENGVSISGTVTVNSGTLDIEGGSFNQPSNTLLNITAPTTGTYNGIAIMQPASNSNQLQVQFGSNNETLDGYIFAPGAEVYLQDHGGGVVATGLVANTIFDKASTIRIPSYDKAHPSTTPNRSITLVE